MLLCRPEHPSIAIVRNSYIRHSLATLTCAFAGENGPPWPAVVVVVVVRRARLKLFDLDEYEELWGGKDQGAEPAGQSLEPDVVCATERA